MYRVMMQMNLNGKKFHQFDYSDDCQVKIQVEKRQLTESDQNRTEKFQYNYRRLAV